MEIAGESRPAPLTAPEIAMMEFAGKIVCDASSIHQTDIDDLRRHGFSDPEIFDIAATAAARCFFSKMLDALGAEPDKEYLGLDEQLRLRLTVGRPMAPASQSESA
jgi:alkylhydroperoxidase family enzyme